MSEECKYWSWLERKLPKLVAEGLLPQDSAEQIKLRCEAEQSDGNNTLPGYFLPTLAAGGGTLIAGGLVLLVSYNWDMLPKITRIVLAALPLLLGACCGIYTLLRGRGQAWREGSAVLTAGGCATLIGLISQIYHTGGELSEFLFLVIALSIALLYIFDSGALALLLTLGLFPCFGGNYGADRSWMELVLYLAFLPFFLHHIRGRVAGTGYYRYLTMLYLAAGLFAFYAAGGGLISLSAGALVLLTGIRLGTQEQTEPRSPRHNPFPVAGFLLLTGLLAAASSSPQFFRVRIHENFTVSIVFWGLIVFDFLLVWLRGLRRGMAIWELDGLLFLLMTVNALVFFLDAEEMQFAANLYLAIAGAGLIFAAFRKKRMRFFNAGMILFFTLAACRFFDNKLPILPRALGFIVLGLGLIGGNILLYRRKHAGKEVAI
ncbi:MAG: DUF2157 domain-containing protein [Victivallaceae bacterium]|nr:DUF2157 domain-containing protein [Victivallaceae bacterium]